MEAAALSVAQMHEVGRLLVEEYGIAPLQTMENTGRSLARLVTRLLDGDVSERSIVVLAGRGNNGGGGLAAARHLLNRGAWVQVVCGAAPEEYTGVAAQQLASLQWMGAALAWAEEGWELPPCDLIVDAIFGCGLVGAPHGKAATLIELAKSSPAAIVSLEGPSGVDLESGELYTPHIVAAATLALGLPKQGVMVEPGRSACGAMFVGEIGVPPELYARLGLEVGALFGRDTVVEFPILDFGF